MFVFCIFKGRRSNIQASFDSGCNCWLSVDGIPQIMHSFYKKPVSSCYTILKKSAVSEKVKKNTLFQESLRRILHVSTSLPWTEVINHLNKWSDCMRISGYSHEERYEAIGGAVMRLDQMKQMVSDGDMKTLNSLHEIVIFALSTSIFPL